MKCAKCGYERQSRDDAFVPISECPACGVVYAKHEAVVDPAATLNPARPPHLKPSPVDALSLRKARERVEKRLREKQEARLKDERHARTLELAKRLTSEQIRRRQEERRQNDADNLAAGQPPADSSSPGDPANEKMASAAPAPSETATTTHNTVVPPEPANPSVSGTSEQPQAEEPVLFQDVVAEDAQKPPENGQPKIYGALTASRQTEDQTPTEFEKPIPSGLVAAAASRPSSAYKSRQGLTRFLPIVAWLILCAGVIGAILSWATINDVQAGVRIPIAESMSTIPLGLLLGFAYLATGVLGFAFFWVSSLISNQLKDIRGLLIADE